MIKKTFRRFFLVVVFVMVMLIAAAAVRQSWRAYYKAAYPVDYGDIVLTQSERCNVPPALVFAVIRTESGFNPSAQSSVLARGLMQITPDTFEWAKFRVKEEADLTFEDLYDSEINIRYGNEILRLLLDEFGSEENALCAYHAGWGNAKKWLNNPEYTPNGYQIENIPFGNTSRYVKKVMQTKAIYEKLYNY